MEPTGSTKISPSLSSEWPCLLSLCWDNGSLEHQVKVHGPHCLSKTQCSVGFFWTDNSPFCDFAITTVLMSPPQFIVFLCLILLFCKPIGYFVLPVFIASCCNSGHGPSCLEASMVICMMILLHKALVLSPVVFLQFELNCLVHSIT